MKSLQMFKEEIITNKETIDFWKSMVQDSSRIRVDERLLYINKTKGDSIIRRKNKGMILNPEADFIQARITSSETESIIVEVLPFVKQLYIGISIASFLFGIFMLAKNNIGGVLVIFLFGLIFLYNYRALNNAIMNFTEILRSKKGVNI